MFDWFKRFFEIRPVDIGKYVAPEFVQVRTYKVGNRKFDEIQRLFPEIELSKVEFSVNGTDFVQTKCMSTRMVPMDKFKLTRALFEN